MRARSSWHGGNATRYLGAGGRHGAYSPRGRALDAAPDDAAPDDAAPDDAAAGTDPDLWMLVYTPLPGTDSDRKLERLMAAHLVAGPAPAASDSATRDQS